MIDYNETKNKLNVRGVDFTPSMFSFALMISIGMDRYQAYKITIMSNKKGWKEDDKEDKYAKDCDIFMEQQNVKSLCYYLKERYDYQISDEAMSCENVEITPKILKNLLGGIIKKASKNLDNTSYSDLIKVVDQYCKQFTFSDKDEVDFARHFIQIFPSFNFCCNQCGKEGDAPIGVDFRCKNCGKLYKWNEEEKRYY